MAWSVVTSPKCKLVFGPVGSPVVLTVYPGARASDKFIHSFIIITHVSTNKVGMKQSEITKERLFEIYQKDELAFIVSGLSSRRGTDEMYSRLN